MYQVAKTTKIFAATMHAVKYFQRVKVLGKKFNIKWPKMKGVMV